MQMPIDIKEIMSAAADIDAARLVPVRILILVDPTAPEDVKTCVTDAFTTTEENATVEVMAYPESQVSIPIGCDLVVLIAGFSEETGALSTYVRKAKCPVLTITTMPEIVIELAQSKRAPLLVEDVLSPTIDVDASALPPESDFNLEPYPLSEDRAESLRAKMGDWMVDIFKEKRLAMALCFPFMRRPLALESVGATAMQNAGVGALVIIPGADMPVMTANQAKMLLQIAAAYGQKMGPERFKELAGVVGGAFALRSVARQVLSVVPIGGWAIKGGIGYAGTQAMGLAAIAYFEQLTGEKSLKDNMADAATTAKDTAADVADILMHASSPKEGIAALANRYAGTLAHNAQSAAREALPQIKSAIPAFKNAVDSAADAAGVDVQEVAKQAFDSFVRNRSGKN